MNFIPKRQAGGWRTAAGGFSLIELMITVTIVGILAAVGYPSYTSFVAKSNRSAAESHVLTLANKQEQYFLDKRQYTDTATDLMATPTDVSDHYAITITTGTTPPSYIITATPNTAQRASDAACGTLTLTQNGTKGISGSGTVAKCW